MTQILFTTRTTFLIRENMICKTYTVLVVICITCLIIFSKFDRERVVTFRYHSFQNGSSTSFFIDTSKVLGVNRSVTAKASDHNPLNITGNKGNSKRMENNNSEKDMMDSSTATIPKDPSLSEDSTDGKFSGHFNIKELNDHLNKCIRESDHEVDMDEYIRTFQQLYKFFCMLGTVFGYIGSDVKTKIEILQGYRDGDNKTHYETVEKMITFEKNTDYIHSNKASSGSRTFLRLHRSLIFVSKFLGKMDEIEEQDGISRICKDAYAQTLAKFHPWIIQKGAGIAMLGLPTKKDLIAKVCANGYVECNEVVDIMHDVIKMTSVIYDQCERLYTEHDLHGLP